MKLLWALLVKDFYRAWRNPVGWIVFLLVPLLVTALPGLVFGPKSGNTALGKVRCALVDEDDSVLSRFLKGSANQGKAGEHLELHLVTRNEALTLVQNGKISAMLVIPKGFTREYLAGTNLVTLELVKNPAESIHPTLIEELTSAVVTALQAVKRNFGSELPELEAMFRGESDYHAASALVLRVGDKLSSAKNILNPPLVVYTTNAPHWGEIASGSEKAGGGEKKPSKSGINVFGYLLPGMVAMFLLFLAESNSRDTQRELAQRTLQRFHSLQHRLHVFVASKVVFGVVFLMMGSVIMLGGGGLIFGIKWGNIPALAMLTVCYCVFASGVMSLLPPLLGFRRESAALGNILGMGIGLAGGSTFPPEMLPAFLRDHVTRYLPNFWYADAVKAVSFGASGANWQLAGIKMTILGAILISVSAILLKWRLERVRA